MKVLLVEDSRILRERLRTLLAGMAQVVVVGETDNESDAIRYLEIHGPDTVVLDLLLHSGSGLSVLETVKAQHPEITVVVFTNYSQPEYRAKCMALGADYFFDKTTDFEAFSLCLQTLSQSPLGSASVPRHGAVT